MSSSITGGDGIAAGEPMECFNPVAVVMRAEALSRKEGHVRAVAFSRTGDPCVYRNLNPNVLTMKSAQYGARIYDAGSLNLARDRRIFVQ